VRYPTSTSRKIILYYDDFLLYSMLITLINVLIKSSKEGTELPVGTISRHAQSAIRLVGGRTDGMEGLCQSLSHSTSCVPTVALQ